MVRRSSLSGARRADEETLALRIEFLRSRARYLRYKEECAYIAAEQQRVLISLEKTALVWDERAGRAMSSVDDPLREGRAVYAIEQAAIQRGLAAKFKRIWDISTNTHASATVADEAAESTPNDPVTTSDAVRLPLIADDSDDEDLQVAGEASGITPSVN